MRQYNVKYAFLGNGRAIVRSAAQILSLYSPTESEALAAVRRYESGYLRDYGKDLDLVILEIRPL